MGRIRRPWSTPARVEGALSVAGAVALVLVALAAAEGPLGWLTALGIAGFVGLAVALAMASAGGVGAAVAVVGLVLAVAHAPAPPVVAAAMFVVVELGLWCTQDRVRLAEDEGLRRDRVLLVVGVASASLALGALLQLLARTDGERGTAYTVLAAACVVGLALLLVGAARTRPTPPR